MIKIPATPSGVNPETVLRFPGEAVLIGIVFLTLLLVLTAFGTVLFLRQLPIVRRSVIAAITAFVFWSGVLLFLGAHWELNLIIIAMLIIPSALTGCLVYFRELGLENTPEAERRPPIEWRRYFETTAGWIIVLPIIGAVFTTGYSLFIWLKSAYWPDMSTAAFLGRADTDWMGLNKIVNAVLELHIAFPLIALFSALLWAGLHIGEIWRESKR